MPSISESDNKSYQTFQIEEVLTPWWKTKRFLVSHRDINTSWDVEMKTRLVYSQQVRKGK